MSDWAWEPLEWLNDYGDVRTWSGRGPRGRIIVDTATKAVIEQYERDLENVVRFVSAETMSNALDGLAVVACFRDGTEATGVWKKFVPADGSQTMVDIRRVDDLDCVVVGSDVRNFVEVVVL